jgi:hypothetical protein
MFRMVDKPFIQRAHGAPYALFLEHSVHKAHPTDLSKMSYKPNVQDRQRNHV